MTEVDDLPGGAAPAGVCTDSDCPIAEGGLCRLGEETPLDCDLFEPSPTAESPAEEPAEPTHVQLRSGDVLRPSEVGQVLRRQPASRVVPLGLVEAGKSTLLAVTFQLLAQGRISGWTLGRTRSLMGFARLCHEASLASGRAEPTQARTAPEGFDRVLHLDVRREADAELRSLLFSDISGELVERLTTGVVDPVLQSALEVATHVPVVIDGKMAAAPGQRQQAIRTGIDIVRVLRDRGLALNARLSLVITKLDHFGDTSYEDVLDRVAAVFPNGVEPPLRFSLAARPKSTSDLDSGTGLLPFLEHLTELPPEVRPTDPWSESVSEASGGVLQAVWGRR